LNVGLKSPSYRFGRLKTAQHRLHWTSAGICPHLPVTPTVGRLVLNCHNPWKGYWKWHKVIVEIAETLFSLKTSYV
jgi:hypothetical protein